MCAARGEDEVLAVAAFFLRARLDKAVLQQARFVAGGLGAQVVEIVHGLAGIFLFCGQVLGITTRGEGFASRVLRLVQQAFDQVPVMFHGGTP